MTALLALAAVAPAVAMAPARSVDAATTGVDSELRKTVPITRRAGAEPRVVLSIGPGKLGGLRRRDRLELLSEVQVTVDCDRPSARCAGRPYHFDPHVIVTLEIAKRRSPAAPSRVVARRALSCRQRLPNRQHHCPVVFDRTTRVGGDFPCRLDRCYANVVVSASSPRAHGDERMIIGANKPSGRIVQNKSRLSAVVLAPGETAQRLVTRKLRRRSLRLRPQRKVVLSQKVDGLERGDVLAVSAALRSDVRQLGYNALVGAELIVARGPRANRPSRLVRRSVWLRGEISPVNGTNCTPVQSPCPTRKVGVVSVRRDVRGRSGAPAPLFVNLVLRTKQKRVGREHGARLRILRRAGLEVRRYSP
ncbi:MAG: hypothetical protein QOI10_3018 [Solirubrobacterales bacterium]|nr:hypothetical protein [Solirubrobacterales bacterium]